MTKSKHKHTHRKTNPIRAYEVGLPVRMMVEMTVHASSRRKAMDDAKERVNKKYDAKLRPYVKRVA